MFDLLHAIEAGVSGPTELGERLSRDKSNVSSRCCATTG
jgi:hypothetical protein